MDAVADKVGTLFDASAMRAIAMTNAGNDYTIEVAPALDADVVAGMSFYLQPSVTNGGPTRLRVHTSNPYYDLVRSDGSPLAPGEFSAGTVYLAVFISGQFMIVSGGADGASTLIDYQVFEVGGTWTKPTGLDDDALVLVEAWGGGGGGGATGISFSGGGGGGAYVWRWLRAGNVGASEVVQVGSGGTAATNPGGTGGVSSFGAHLIAYGGGGGFGVNGTAFTGGGGGGAGWGSSGATGSTDTPGSAGGIYSALSGGGGGGKGSVSGGGPGAAAGYGGGGGGGSGAGAGGTSLFGGAGGNAGLPGAPRGGGGGGGAPGGRGEVVVRVIRPANRATAGAVSIADGIAAEPGLSFGNDPDTGIMRVGENELGLVAGGTIGMRQRGDQTLFLDGNAVAPAISFAGDLNTGFFRPYEDAVGLSIGGKETLRLDLSGMSLWDVAGDEDVRLTLHPTPFAYSQFGASSTITFVDSGGARPFVIYTDAAERMRVDSAGRVLIGTSAGGGSVLRIASLPTSPAGLSPGDVWVDGGFLKIA
jgi:hypothetical protein